MNPMGQRALDQHRRHRPLEHMMFDDPETTFARVGEQMEGEIDFISRQIAGECRPGESPAEWETRKRQAKVAAEEIVIADHWAFQPQELTEEEQDEELLNDPVIGERVRLETEVLNELQRIEQMTDEEFDLEFPEKTA